MKALLLINLSIFLTSLAVALFLAFVGAIIIQGVFYGTELKTDFFLNFSLFLSILSLMSLVILTVKNFFIFKEIADLRKEWKIPAKDIIEGIYTYEINYCYDGAEKFLELLQEAKRNNHESHA